MPTNAISRNYFSDRLVSTRLDQEAALAKNGEAFWGKLVSGFTNTGFRSGELDPAGHPRRISAQRIRA